MNEMLVEQVYLDPVTLLEVKGGVPYTRKVIGQAVILIAGHEATDSDEAVLTEGGDEE